MKSDISDISAKLIIELRRIEGSIFMQYKANEHLKFQKVLNKVTIKLVDSDGKFTGEHVNVIIQKETFEFFNGTKNETLHYIYPVGVKVTKTKTVTTIKDGIIYGKTKDTKVSSEDITSGYSFDFLKRALIPKGEGDYGECNYEYKKETSLWFWNTETIEETVINVTTNGEECDFKVNKCECVRTDWKDGENRNTPKCIISPETPNKITIRVNPHEFPDRLNEVKITSIEFTRK